MTKAIEAPTTSRRQFLVAAPAALAVAGAPIAAAAPSPGVTPELADLIKKREVARTEYLRLSAISDAATATYYDTAPEIPERILAWPNTYADGIDRMPKEYDGHLRFALGKGRDTLKPSWWRQRVENAHAHQHTEWWVENIRIAEEFEAADEAASAAAGYGSVDDKLEAAVDIVNELDREIEQFDAQTFADIVAIARVSKVIAQEQEIFQESWDDLLRNIFRVAGVEA